jgi:NADPH2:quinone reductase
LIFHDPLFFKINIWYIYISLSWLDEWCLVHAAAGGVGIVAVQIAKALGAKVIATGGSQEKLVVAKKNGADYAVNYRDKDWPKQVLKITGGKGVDVVYDS